MQRAFPFLMTSQNSSPDTTRTPSPAAVENAFEIDPNITKSICADYEALSNDLEQAHALAADFQQELRGKSNEVAHLKQVLQKSESDLAKLQVSITDLREERHRLANELTAALAVEFKLTKVTDERDRLVIELERSQARCRALEVAQKAVPVVRSPHTRRPPAAPPAPPQPPPPPPPEPANAVMKAAVSEISEAMQRLLEVIERSEASPRPAPRPTAAQSPKRAQPPEEDKTIEISFMP